jgi:hypothetical protein
MSTRKSDMLKNADWYNTYRRCITTENNWRYGYSNTTAIDTEWKDMHGDKNVIIEVFTLATNIILEYDHRSLNGSE